MICHNNQRGREEEGMRWGETGGRKEEVTEKKRRGDRDPSKSCAGTGSAFSSRGQRSLQAYWSGGAKENMAFYSTELREHSAVKISVAKIQLGLASTCHRVQNDNHAYCQHLSFPDVVARTDLLGYTSSSPSLQQAVCLQSRNEHPRRYLLCVQKRIYCEAAWVAEVTKHSSEVRKQGYCHQERVSVLPFLENCPTRSKEKMARITKILVIR